MLINTPACQKVDMENRNGHGMIYLSPLFHPAYMAKEK
jgi:hypothetical protein